MTEMLVAQSQISFDDDHELFRQDTDHSEDDEDVDSSSHHEEDDEEEEEELLIDFSTAELQGKKERRKDAPAVEKKKRRPLTLVELPVDVLKEIVKEVNHTNDLTNLSLTCHCLHALAIPHIYSRFDIVWPDALTPGDRTGVDALTYGLATLVAAGPRGNDYARWVKKFSLGNGPAEWVSEYNINKEGGKMLGTLVCLAITRMAALETFSWDMPTGVLRDVFKALHDLNGRLKNVHVRFHDNTETATPTSQDPKRRVETPTFSGFRGLRSLSVLDIDERAYLEEISYAVEQSVGTLRELRLGLAAHVAPCGRWVRDLDEVPHGDAGVIGGQAAAVGGVLGIVVGRIVDLEEGRRRRKTTRAPESVPAVVQMPEGAPVAPVGMEHAITVPLPPALSAESSIVVVGEEGETDVGVLSTLPFNIVGPAAVQETIPSSSSTSTPTLTPTPAPPPLFASDPPAAPPPPPPPTAVLPRPIKVKSPSPDDDDKPHRQLKLDTLELERIPISIRVLTKAIDWPTLTNLTLLNCHDHDRLWKALRHKFSPTSKLPTSPYHPQADTYRLRLKKLHTDTVTPQLLYFIRDTLPPNTLEVLFLQETPAFSSPVTTDFIYRAAIRRHRSSLRKLLIDSNVSLGGDAASKWIFDKEVLTFVTSGKMPALRELGLAIEWKNWHYFLTRLPHAPQLRSLYIHYVRGGPHITDCEAKEMAQQIVNTVVLRPEIEVCYVGVLNKCFELLEDGSGAEEPSVPVVGVQVPVESEYEDDDDDDEDEDEDEEGGEEGDSGSEGVEEGGGEETEEEGSVRGWGGGEGGVRLREILFYDDKVAVFRARSGKL